MGSLGKPDPTLRLSSPPPSAACGASSLETGLLLANTYLSTRSEVCFQCVMLFRQRTFSWFPNGLLSEMGRHVFTGVQKRKDTHDWETHRHQDTQVGGHGVVRVLAEWTQLGLNDL